MSLRRPAVSAFFFLTFATAAAAQSPPSSGAVSWQQVTDDLRRLLDEQRAVNARQAQQLDTLARELDALRSRLDATPDSGRIVNASVATTLPAESPEIASLQPPSTEVDQATKRLPELPQKIVTAGTFPGSITIPGTDVAFAIGGQARSSMVHTFAPLGTDDRFIASSIPVGEEHAGDEARTTYTAAPSRVNFDLRSAAPFGAIRTFIEGDFGGSGNTARLRHAYIQTDHWVFGQTWSTFSDPEVEPADIDFEGENAISRFRQAQVRYSRALREHLDLGVSLENPAPDLTGAAGVNLTPDVVARLRWDPESASTGPLSQPAHLQPGILFRTLRGQLAQSDTTLATEGFGGAFSGVLIPNWASTDRVKFAIYGGWGIGRYITDLSAAGGQDAVYDPATNTLRALPVTSAYVGYEHRWRPAFLSAFTYGVAGVDNLDVQTADALRRSQRATANLTWNPMPRADLVFEVLAGQRVNKDGQRGTSSQFQAGYRFRF
jgi:hypothetical protein